MGDTFAPDVDRLPWLADDRAPPKRLSRWWSSALSALALAGVAMASFWIGLSQTRPSDETTVQSAPEAIRLPPPAATVPMPAPIERATQEPQPVPMPEVEPAPMPAPVVVRMQEDVRPAIEPAPRPRRVVKRTRLARAKAAPAPAPVKSEPVRKPLGFSNPWESAGASGRMVRIGAYSSLRQGKQAWSKLAKAFPAMKKLPAVVTDIPSQRNGRVYYRLQIGTTSQAHSEVLCQRMRTIGQSCVVVDLAGARKGSWDERQPAGL